MSLFSQIEKIAQNLKNTPSEFKLCLGLATYFFLWQGKGCLILMTW